MPEKDNIIIRPAKLSDLQSIADAHRASIHEIGPDFYEPDLIKIWGRKRELDSYKNAIENDGEVYFIAEKSDCPHYALGFSSYHFRNDRHHLAALYVRGSEARKGVGLQLLHAVEATALAKGAAEIYVEGSLSAEAFYKCHGYTEHHRTTHPMTDGQQTMDMDVIHMMKKF